MSFAGLLARKGAAVVFSKTTAGSYDETTDRTTAPTTATVSGRAIEIGGDPELFKALELIGTDTVLLQFTPDIPGTQPPIDASVTWGGQAYTVKSIPDRLAMDGTAKAMRVVVTR